MPRACSVSACKNSPPPGPARATWGQRCVLTAEQSHNHTSRLGSDPNHNGPPRSNTRLAWGTGQEKTRAAASKHMHERRRNALCDYLSTHSVKDKNVSDQATPRQSPRLWRVTKTSKSCAQWPLGALRAPDSLKDRTVQPVVQDNCIYQLRTACHRTKSAEANKHLNSGDDRLKYHNLASNKAVNAFPASKANSMFP